MEAVEREVDKLTIVSQDFSPITVYEAGRSVMFTTTRPWTLF
jgi:hypothetical protein